jgi:hypothetical protein
VLANWGRIAVRQIDATIGQTYAVYDVMDFARRNLPPNRPLDLIAKVGGFFDAHSGGSSKMKLERAAVDAGEEVLAKPGMSIPREPRQTSISSIRRPSQSIGGADFRINCSY